MYILRGTTRTRAQSAAYLGEGRVVGRGHIVESAGRQRAFLTVGMTGAIANHMMKQMKKFNHAKWNARECGRENEKIGAICPETGCVMLPSSQ